MVTKLSDGRGQVTLKGHAVSDEWETLVKTAAKRNGQGLADFLVNVTRDAAQAILKGSSAVPAAVPARPEDVADKLAERFAEELAKRDAAQAERAAEQDAKIEALAAKIDGQSTDQTSATVFAELRRLARRGRWR
jgi:uncharacterized protein (DUF1778 family)